MKIIRIIGGMGNQMFQYALYWALKRRFPDDIVKLDVSCFRGYNVHNGLEISSVFGIDIPQASFMELLKVTRPVYNYKISAALRKLLPPRETECFEATDYTLNKQVFSEGDRYYWGYWQNWKYFIDYADEIRDSFSFKLPVNNKTAKLLNEIEQNGGHSTVSVHVRRGDYLKAPNYAGLCGVEYYRKAVSYIMQHVENPSFLVFSDDMEWCRTELSPILGDAKVTFVDWNKGTESALDMLLMSRCHHNIIANSSFSWWGAFLNRNRSKIVCAPEKWTNTKVNCMFQLPDWILF